MAVTMNTRWDDNGTVIPAAAAKYTVAEQPIAEYDNWFNSNIVADVQAVIDDVINKFNANTILKADTDNDPAALVVAEQTIVGRKTGNSIAALTDAEVLVIIGVEAGATADQTNTEIRDAVEAAADSNTFTDNDHTKLNGVDSGADVTGSNAPQQHHVSHESGGSDEVDFFVDGSYTSVFNGAAPSAAWVDLDLSVTVGAANHLVALRARAATGGMQAAFRTKGDTYDHLNMAAISGIQQIYYSDTHPGVALVMTDGSGIVQWHSNINTTTIIELLWYI